MSSAAQQKANQAKARQFTGPVTKQGKAASSRNNLRHGFRSQTVLLPGDDTAAYEALLADLSEYYAPGDLTELRFVREMADADWRLRRVREHQESAISRQMAKIWTTNRDLPAMELQSIAIETLSETGTSYGTWLRYETKFERQHDRAFKDWSKYQELRRDNAMKEADLAMKNTLAATPPEPPHQESASNVQNAQNEQNAPQPPAESASNVQNIQSAPQPATESASTVQNAQIVRNAPCACGSRLKYKRCCGRNSPAVLAKAA
jgi:hypothetical protein